MVRREDLIVRWDDLIAIRSDPTSITAPRIDSSEPVMTIADDAMTTRERATTIGGSGANPKRSPMTSTERAPSTMRYAIVITSPRIVIRYEAFSITSPRIDLRRDQIDLRRHRIDLRRHRIDPCRDRIVTWRAIVVPMQRRTVLLLGAALCLSLTACAHGAPGAAEPSAVDLKKLTVDEVAARLAANDGRTFVYDDNSQESWKERHVPGAKWLDEDAVTAAALPPDKSATLIFYCHNEL